MQRIFDFLRRNSPFFTWLLFAVVGISLLCYGNPYHRGVWLGSANRVVGQLYSIKAGVTGYFNLRSVNESLLERTAQLETENLRLRERLQISTDSLYLAQDTLPHYEYSVAHVVNNTIMQAENYITLDRGAADGVMADMGVADQHGVVGIVTAVSQHFSLVISVLNPRLRLSAMIQHTQAYGSLVWDGHDPRYVLLEKLPRSVTCQAGDTVVTTGYSASFPRDVPIGTVVETFDDGSSFLKLRVQLFTPFDRLSTVHVIRNNKQTEQKALEQQKN